MRSWKMSLVALTLALMVAGLAVTATQAAGSGAKAKPPSNPTPTPAPTATPCSGCPTLHVLAIVVGASKNVDGSTYATCRVVIADAADNILEGATVVHQWSGAFSGTMTDVTAPHPPYATSTWVTVNNGPKCSTRNPTRIYTCTVLDVSMPGYQYDAPSNVETSDSDDACAPG